MCCVMCQSLFMLILMSSIAPYQFADIEFYRENYLFRLFIDAKNIERHFPAKRSTSSLKEHFHTILTQSNYGSLSHIVKFACLQTMLQNLAWNPCCCSQDFATKGRQRLHLHKVVPQYKVSTSWTILRRSSDNLTEETNSNKFPIVEAHDRDQGKANKNIISGR